MSTEGGAIEYYSEADWIVGWVVNRDDIAEPEFTFEDNEFEYNQDEFERNTCTVYQAIGAYSDLRGQYIGENTRKELVEKAIEQWLDTSIGWYVHRAVKLVADYFGDVSYARVAVWWDDYDIAKDMGFSLMEWYRGNRTYKDDRDDDWVVDTNNRGTHSYWHARRAWWEDNRTDNYAGRNTNIYRLPELEKKMESGNIFSRAYIYFDRLEMPDWNLPPHVSPASFSTPLAKETAKAWETEMKIHMLRWWKLLYTNYYSSNPKDYDQILARYLNDLQEFRREQ